MSVEGFVDFPSAGGWPGWPSFGSLFWRCRLLVPSVGDAPPGGVAHEGGVAVDPMTIPFAIPVAPTATLPLAIRILTVTHSSIFRDTENGKRVSKIH